MSSHKLKKINPVSCRLDINFIEAKEVLLNSYMTFGTTRLYL